MTLYRKYRPQFFGDLVGQDHIRDTLIQAVKEGRLAQAYLFSGPRGTGKTTTARLIARVANCEEIEKNRLNGKPVEGEPCGKCSSCIEIAAGRSIDIIEIDAASNRGIDEIRELREQARYAPAKSKYKVYIIDEVHMLTREAFNALLKTLEEPPGHVIFILATTEPHKVLPTIISRTQRFEFKRIAPEALIANMQKVVKSEGLKADKEALEMLSSLADGGGRDSLSLLEQVSAYSSDISASNVKSILGLAEIGQIISLLRAIFNSHAEEGLKIAHSLFEAGSNINQLNASIVDVLRKLLTLSVAGSFLTSETGEDKEQIQKLFAEIAEVYGEKTLAKILSVIKSFIDAGKMMKETIDPLVAMEVAIVESQDSSQIKNQKSKIKIAEMSPIKAKTGGKSVVAEVELKVAEKSSLSEAKTAPDPEPIPPKNGTKNAAREIGAQSDQPVAVGNGALSELSPQAWASVIGEVKKENTTLAALLKDAKPMEVASGKLVLGVRFKFHKDKISEAKNVKILEGVICSVTGDSCRVSCEIADFSKKENKESHSDDELASEAEKVFGE